MIQAKVIAHSKNGFKNEICTMIVTMPRFILAEFNTHRMFSRNSASSRAIPFERMLESVQNNPFVPIAWQRDHKGMQGTEYITDPKEVEMYNKTWLDASIHAMNQAEGLNLEGNGVTKQLCNRLLEPFMWHTVIVTATEWENFFALRCPRYEYIGEGDNKYLRSKKDYINHANNVDSMQILNPNAIDWKFLNKGQAEIHMMALAEAMWDCYNESTPKELKEGEWHIPFGDTFDKELFNEIVAENWGKETGSTEELSTQIAIKIATARCARVSYTVVGEEGKPTNYKKDIELHNRLAMSGHWSPMEHCARAMSIQDQEEYRDLSKLYEIKIKGNPEKMRRKGLSYGWSGNFKGFIQYRKTFENENLIN